MTREDRLRAIWQFAWIVCACCCAGCSSQIAEHARSETATHPRPSEQRTPPSQIEHGATQDDPGETGFASYRIIKDEHLRNIKRSVDVRLPRAASEANLERFAREIHARDPGYDRTFIVWLLPGMEPGAGAWATTHFDPLLEVRILGHSAGETRAAFEYARAHEGAIGRWFDLTPFIGGVILLQRSEGGLVIVHRFKDGSELRREVRERRAGGAKRLVLIGDFGEFFGEYYVIRSDGILEMYNDNGLIKRIDPL